MSDLNKLEQITREAAEEQSRSESKKSPSIGKALLIGGGTLLFSLLTMLGVGYYTKTHNAEVEGQRPGVRVEGNLQTQAAQQYPLPNAQEKNLEVQQKNLCEYSYLELSSMPPIQLANTLKSISALLNDKEFRRNLKGIERPPMFASAFEASNDTKFQEFLWRAKRDVEMSNYSFAINSLSDAQDYVTKGIINATLTIPIKIAKVEVYDVSGDKEKALAELFSIPPELRIDDMLGMMLTGSVPEEQITQDKKFHLYYGLELLIKTAYNPKTTYSKRANAVYWITGACVKLHMRTGEKTFLDRAEEFTNALYIVSENWKAQIFSQLGELNYQRGRFDEAIKNYETAYRASEKKQQYTGFTYGINKDMIMLSLKKAKQAHEQIKK